MILLIYQDASILFQLNCIHFLSEIIHLTNSDKKDVRISNIFLVSKTAWRHTLFFSLLHVLNIIKLSTWIKTNCVSEYLMEAIPNQPSSVDSARKIQSFLFDWITKKYLISCVIVSMSLVHLFWGVFWSILIASSIIGTANFCRLFFCKNRNNSWGLHLNWFYHE